MRTLCECRILFILGCKLMGSSPPRFAPSLFLIAILLFVSAWCCTFECFPLQLTDGLLEDSPESHTAKSWAYAGSAHVHVCGFVVLANGLPATASLWLWVFWHAIGFFAALQSHAR